MSIDVGPLKLCWQGEVELLKLFQHGRKGTVGNFSSTVERNIETFPARQEELLKLFQHNGRNY